MAQIPRREYLCPEAGDLLKEMQRRLLAEMELHQDDSPLMEVLRTRCGA